MTKNHFNKKKVTAAEVTPAQTEASAPALELGEVNLNEEPVVVHVFKVVQFFDILYR